MTTIKRRGWQTSFTSTDFPQGDDRSDKPFSEFTSDDLRVAAGEANAVETATYAVMDGPDQRLEQRAKQYGEKRERLLAQASEMGAIYDRQPPETIRALGEHVRAARPDLDVYWEPRSLPGSYGDVHEWSLVADDPGGVQFARISFDTIDKDAAKHLIDDGEPALIDLYTDPMVEKGWTNFPTQVVATEVMNESPAVCAYMEAVVERDHGGPGAPDLVETTGVDIDHVESGALALRDFVNQPSPKAEREMREATAQVERTTGTRVSDLDMGEVNWQEIYDWVCDEMGLPGDTGFEDRLAARKSRVHQLEGRIMGATIGHGEYVTGPTQEHAELHGQAHYPVQEVEQAGYQFLEEIHQVPSDQRPDTTNPEQYAALHTATSPLAQHQNLNPSGPGL